MAVNRHQLMNELEMKLLDDGEIADNVADVARQVEFHWKAIVTKPGEHYAAGKGGYATGAYEASIHRESVRGRAPKGARDRRGKKIGGQFVWQSRVVSDSPIAHLLEYGTVADHDPENSQGNWVDTKGKWHKSPWTPTPAFAWAAQVERDFT
jgi:hypothetical protein